MHLFIATTQYSLVYDSHNLAVPSICLGVVAVILFASSSSRIDLFGSLKVSCRLFKVVRVDDTLHLPICIRDFSSRTLTDGGATIIAPNLPLGILCIIWIDLRHIFVVWPSSFRK